MGTWRHELDLRDKFRRMGIRMGRSVLSILFIPVLFLSILPLLSVL